MTRKRLWSLTAVVCAVLMVPGLPQMRMPRVDLQGIRLALMHLPALHLPRLDASLVSLPSMAVATGLLLLSVAIVIARARRTAGDRVVALARRGRPVVAIARQTRLSQDAIRDLLGGEPMVVSTARMGRIFRRRSKQPPKAPASFAEELSEKSFDARA